MSNTSASDNGKYFKSEMSHTRSLKNKIETVKRASLKRQNSPAFNS